MKRYENGEAPLQETGVEQLVSTTTQTPNAPLSLLTLRSIRAAFFCGHNRIQNLRLRGVKN
jgi:hypothetical protein